MAGTTVGTSEAGKTAGPACERNIGSGRLREEDRIPIVGIISFARRGRDLTPRCGHDASLRNESPTDNEVDDPIGDRRFFWCRATISPADPLNGRNWL